MSRLARIIQSSPEVRALAATEMSKHAERLERDRPLIEEFLRASERLSQRIAWDRRTSGLAVQGGDHP